MGWARFDDQYDEHPKVLNAGETAAYAQIKAILYCNRHDTDGFISTAAAQKLLLGINFDMESGAPVRPYEIAARLVRAGLWEAVPDGYRIHDYLDYQPGRHGSAKLSAVRAEAGRKGAQARWSRSATSGADEPDGHPGPTSSSNTEHDVKKSSESPMAPHGKTMAKNAPVPVPVPVPKDLNTNTLITPQGDTDSDLSAPGYIDGSAADVCAKPPNGVRDDVQAFYGHYCRTWADVFPKGPTLTKPRQRQIRRRLDQFDLGTLKRACDNLHESAFHRGDNPAGRKYGTLDLLVRDDETVDTWANSPTVQNASDARRNYLLERARQFVEGLDVERSGEA